jgi:hypothetical protein
MKLWTFRRQFQTHVVSLINIPSQKQTSIDPRNANFVIASVSTKVFKFHRKAASSLIMTENQYTDVSVPSAQVSSDIVMKKSLELLQLSDMIVQIPFLIQLRKRLNIDPGDTNQDPVLQLLRCVHKRRSVLVLVINI